LQWGSKARTLRRTRQRPCPSLGKSLSSSSGWGPSIEMSLRKAWASNFADACEQIGAQCACLHCVNQFSRGPRGFAIFSFLWAVSARRAHLPVAKTRTSHSKRHLSSVYNMDIGPRRLACSPCPHPCCTELRCSVSTAAGDNGAAIAGRGPLSEHIPDICKFLHDLVYACEARSTDAMIYDVACKRNSSFGKLGFRVAVPMLTGCTFLHDSMYACAARSADAMIYDVA
jgi:hypothetical protein